MESGPVPRPEAGCAIFPGGVPRPAGEPLQALGYAIERKRDDFELAGIAASAIRKFSRRTDKIEEEAKKRGIEDPEEKARLGGLTRERKDKSLTWQELRAEWDNWLTPQERAGDRSGAGGAGSEHCARVARCGGGGFRGAA